MAMLSYEVPGRSSRRKISYLVLGSALLGTVQVSVIRPGSEASAIRAVGWTGGGSTLTRRFSLPETTAWVTDE